MSICTLIRKAVNSPHLSLSLLRLRGSIRKWRWGDRNIHRVFSYHLAYPPYFFPLEYHVSAKFAFAAMLFVLPVLQKLFLGHRNINFWRPHDGRSYSSRYTNAKGSSGGGYRALYCCRVINPSLKMTFDYSPSYRGPQEGSLTAGVCGRHHKSTSRMTQE